MYAWWSDPNIRLRPQLYSSQTADGEMQMTIALQPQRWVRFLVKRHFLLIQRDEVMIYKNKKKKKHFPLVVRMFLKDEFIFPSPMLNSQCGFTFTDGGSVCYSTFSYPWLEVDLEITSVESQTATHYRNDVMTAFQFCFPWGNIKFQRWLEGETCATPPLLCSPAKSPQWLSNCT